MHAHGPLIQELFSYRSTHPRDRRRVANHFEDANVDVLRRVLVNAATDDACQTVSNMCSTSRYTHNQVCTDALYFELCSRQNWTDKPDRITYKQFFYACCDVRRRLLHTEDFLKKKTRDRSYNLRREDMEWFANHMLNGDHAKQFLNRYVFFLEDEYPADRSIASELFDWIKDDLANVRRYIVNRLTDQTIVRTISSLHMYNALPERLQQNEDVILALLKQIKSFDVYEVDTHTPLQTALRRHSNNTPLILLAIALNSRFIQCASETLRSDEDFVSTIIAEDLMREAVAPMNPAAYRISSVPPRELVHTNVSLDFWKTKIRDYRTATYCLFVCLDIDGSYNRELMLHALQFNGTLIRHQYPNSDPYAHDLELARVALAQNIRSLTYVSKVFERIAPNIVASVMYMSTLHGSSVTGEVCTMSLMSGMPRYAEYTDDKLRALIWTSGYANLALFDHERRSMYEMYVPLTNGTIDLELLEEYYTAHSGTPWHDDPRLPRGTFTQLAWQGEHSFNIVSRI